MRKLKYLIPILILSVAFSVCLFSCKKSGVSSFSLSFNGATLSWSEVEKASYYTVHCTFPDGTGYSVSTKNISYPCPQTAIGDYLYTVDAYDKSRKKIAQSDKIVYHLGKGSYAGPILISGKDELKAVTSGAITVKFGETEVAVPLHYALTGDLDLGNEPWNPIGSTSSPFLGVFDGNGHAIRGLLLKACNTDAKVGLFGSI